MIIRLAIAALVLWVVYLVWRNLGARARFETEQRKAWDEPLREGGVYVLTASSSAWWWLVGLGLVTAVTGRALFERMTAGAGVGDTFWHWLVFLGLAAVCARRAVQLSERVTVTWDRIASRTLLGEKYSLPLDDVTAVTETDRTALVAFEDGRVLELPPWLEGRFWLARELKARQERRFGSGSDSGDTVEA